MANIAPGELRTATPIGGAPRRRYLIYALIPAAAVLLAAGAEFLVAPRAGPSAEAAALPRPGYGPKSYAEAMHFTADQLDLGRERVRYGPGEWLRQESLARALMSRARLSSTYDELAEANAVLVKAQGLSPKGAGPLMSEAELAMMIHRLAPAEAALAVLERSAVPLDNANQFEATALTGDIAFYRGDMAGARRGYADAARIADVGAVGYRLAVLAKAQGDYDAASTDFRRSMQRLKTPSPQQLATIILQLGAVELARGDTVAARRYFVDADRLLPGFWLIEAHLAQSDALAGNMPRAIARMREIAQRTQSAEVMDALAMLLRTNGDAAESHKWAARAGEVWQRRLDQLPEAAYGHAVEHEVVFGSPARALDLAQRNLAIRPFGESRLLMANALLVNGRVPDALEQLRLAEASGWRSAPLYALRAEAEALAGHPDLADAARRDATALNPHIFDPETSLVWFSHG